VFCIIFQVFILLRFLANYIICVFYTFEFLTNKRVSIFGMQVGLIIIRLKVSKMEHSTMTVL